MKTLRHFTFVIACAFVALSAFDAVAQQVGNHAIPVGRGANQQGFKQVGPCAANIPIVGDGASADPKCLPNQSANTVWAGPTSGGAAAPSFRQLQAADITGLTPGRTVLTGATTFYVNPNGSSANCNGVTCGAGSDTTGDGSLATPWATRVHAIFTLAASYDLNNQEVTIQLADGTYNTSFQVFLPRLTGQGSPRSIIFNGNSTTPSNVVIQPAAGVGYAYGFFYGFSATIQNQWVDQSNQFASLGQDILSVGQQSFMYLGTGVIFGCAYPGSGQNAISITTGGQLYFAAQSDLKIDTSKCQKGTTGTFSSGSSTIALASASNIYVGMGITSTASGSIPRDAYIAVLAGTTATLGCVMTSPCQTTGAGTSENLIAFGGGQFFINAGTGGIVYAETNGQSEYAVVITLASSSFYYDMAFINGLSNANVQGISWVSPSLAHGGCFEAVNISVIDTGNAGSGYFPCFQGPSALNIRSTTLTSGSNSFVVSSATNVRVGQAINGYAGPTGTWTAGSSTIALSSATGVCIGGVVSGAGIAAGGGSVISNLSGTTATLAPCAAAGRCVGGYATYLPQTNTPLSITGCGLPNGTWITGVSGTTITTNKPASASGGYNVLFSQAGGGPDYTGVQDYSVYH